MFIFRGFAVSLAIFALRYSALSALVVVGWPLLVVLNIGGRSLLACFFAVRVLPLVASGAVTLAFVVPSFQILEPRSAGESMGAMPLVFGVFGIVLAGPGFFGAVAAQRKAARIVTG